MVSDVRAQQPDLAAWLLACVDEDEHWARAATEFNGAEWSCPSTAVVDTGASGLDGLLPVQDRGLGYHIARWDPARVLAECDTKRRIVALHAHSTETSWPDRSRHWEVCWECGAGPGNQGCVPWPCETLRLMAAVYKHRDGYRQEWEVDR